MEKTVNISDSYERLFRYYYLILSHQYKGREFDEVWDEYIRKYDQYQQIIPHYKRKIVEIDFRVFVEEYIEKEEKKSTYDVIDHVKQLWEKECEWEKKSYEYLNSLAQKHPLIAWFVVTVLLSILLGLVTDVISDGISSGKDIDQKAVFEYMEAEDIQMILEDEQYGYKVLYDNDELYDK